MEIQHYGDPADHLAEVLLRMMRYPPYHRSKPCEPVSTFARLWFQKGVFLAIRDGIDLGEALGLNAAGTRSLRTRLLLLKRDRHIAEALREVALDDGVTLWARCQRLAPRAREMSAQWSRLQRAAEPLAGWDACKRELFLAHKVGIGVPGTAQGLRNCHQRAATCSLESRPSNMLANFL